MKLRNVIVGVQNEILMHSIILNGVDQTGDIVIL
jgi:hypothetical protein